MGVFDSKHFNSEVFGKYLETVPRVKQNAFLNAGLLNVRNELKNMLAEQSGGNYITVPMVGLIGGDELNYDGSTDITATNLDTYLQNMIVYGRAKAWTERDFSFDITGKDFMAEIAKQVVNYWDDRQQATMLAILKGIFAGTHAVATNHTLDISGETTNNVCGATTLNDVIQKAAGANKNIFKLVIMHSQVATNLENLQLLEYAKGTDANGIEKDVTLATWNGRTVMIDDDVPAEAVAESASGKNDGYTKYTTYVLGTNAFDYCDIGAKVPNEPWRDPKKNGGEDYLITRQRKLIMPRGFSFVQPSTPLVSPTNANFETAARWKLVTSSVDGTVIDHRAIPIAQIISRG